MVGAAVGEGELGRVGEEVRIGPKEQRQLAYSSKQLTQRETERQPLLLLSSIMCNAVYR